jgi:hypothetical protein
LPIEDIFHSSLLQHQTGIEIRITAKSTLDALKHFFMAVIG